MDDARSFLGKKVHVKIERPIGSEHPLGGFTYPVNYGFVPGTTGGDGEEIDAFVLGPAEPLEEFDGVCIAVIHRRDDDEEKLVVAEEGKDFSDAEIMAALHFQEKHFKSEVVRK